MPILLGIVVAIHGLITIAIGAGTLNGGRPVSTPGMNWYPVSLGQSWLLSDGAARIGSGLWILAGVGLVLTASALLGIVLPRTAWPVLGLGSAVVGLVALALFFHPYYAIGILANVAILGAATVFRSNAKTLLGI
ncbi:MAG TPA: hypothetical protein VFB69_04550 [Candidatus Dormibacteraeota bacterium]|nr:hypothetical protein [Candidatus Dormibacteraeota bacterium]